MADPENGVQSDTDPAQSGAGVTGTTTTGTTDPGAQSGTGESSPEATVSAKELEQQRERTRAADQRAATLEAQLKQLRDKDLPEAEKTKKDLEEATAAREKAEEDLKQSRLELAFLKDNKYKWKNPSSALKLADLTKVDVLDDGSVTGLTSALDALAKSDPYLLDTETSATGGQQGQQGSTGATGTGGRSATATGTDLKKAAVRIPALRTRGLGNS